MRHASKNIKRTIMWCHIIVMFSQCCAICSVRRQMIIRKLAPRKPRLSSYMTLEFYSSRLQQLYWPSLHPIWLPSNSLSHGGCIEVIRVLLCCSSCSKTVCTNVRTVLCKRNIKKCGTTSQINFPSSKFSKHQNVG